MYKISDQRTSKGWRLYDDAGREQDVEVAERSEAERLKEILNRGLALLDADVVAEPERPTPPANEPQEGEAE